MPTQKYVYIDSIEYYNDSTACHKINVVKIVTSVATHICVIIQLFIYVSTPCIYRIAQNFDGG